MKIRSLSLEGGEGTGKTTIMNFIANYLERLNLNYLITREPGGVRIAEAVREIILDVNHTEMDSRTEALLYAAARRQHLVQKVLPAINDGKIVVFDRFVHSSMVYQGYVRGIGIEEVKELNEFATDGFLPDLTIILDLDPEIGIARVMGNDREVNRLDLEGMSFHRKVRDGYLIVSKLQDNIEVIDADGTIEEVQYRVKKVLDKYFLNTI